LSHEDLIECVPRQILFDPLVAHHDEPLRFCMAGRRVALGNIQDPIEPLLGYVAAQVFSAHPPLLNHHFETHNTTPC
jgi:hypothetical protein